MRLVAHHFLLLCGCMILPSNPFLHVVCTPDHVLLTLLACCRLDDLQHLLVMSGTALETRTALMNVLTALPHQHDSSAPGGQPGQLSQLPAMPQQAPGRMSGLQGKHWMEAPPSQETHAAACSF